MYEKVIRFVWHNLGNILIGQFVEVKSTNMLRITFLNKWISHLPKGNRSAVEEFLNAELFVLVKQLWACTVFGLSAEDGLLECVVN